MCLAAELASSSDGPPAPLTAAERDLRLAQHWADLAQRTGDQAWLNAYTWSTEDQYLATTGAHEFLMQELRALGAGEREASTFWPVRFPPPLELARMRFGPPRRRDRNATANATVAPTPPPPPGAGGATGPSAESASHGPSGLSAAAPAAPAPTPFSGAEGSAANL